MIVPFISILKNGFFLQLSCYSENIEVNNFQRAPSLCMPNKKWMTKGLVFEKNECALCCQGDQNYQSFLEKITCQFFGVLLFADNPTSQCLFLLVRLDHCQLTVKDNRKAYVLDAQFLFLFNIMSYNSYGFTST